MFLIAGGIPLPGWTVMVERHRLRGRLTDMLVSVAGLAVNVVAGAVLLGFSRSSAPEVIYGLDEPRAAFWAALTLPGVPPIATALLNLCPIPGLDGYGMAEPSLRDDRDAVA